MKNKDEVFWIVIHEPTNVIVSPVGDFPSEREAAVWLQRMIALGQFKLPFLEYRVLSSKAHNDLQAAKVLEMTNAERNAAG